MTQSQKPSRQGGTTADNGSSAKLGQIEADIDQTRNAISEDLRTLGDRLSPEHLKQEAKEVMLEAKHVAVETLHEAKNVATSTFREVKDSAMDTVSEKVDELRENVRSAEREAVGFVRDNAIPLALIGVGVAWFVSNRRARDDRWARGYEPRGRGRWRYPEQRGSHPIDDARDGASRVTGTVREAASQTKDRAQHWVEDAAHRVSDAAGEVRGFAEREAEHVRGTARDAEQKLSQVAKQTRDFAGRELAEARDVARRATSSHPLAVGAAAVAAGVCVGLMIPTTRRESELFGAERDRLFDGAKGAVEDLTHTAKETARDVTSSLSSIGS